MDRGQGNRIKNCHYLSVIDSIYWHFFKDLISETTETQLTLDDAGLGGLRFKAHPRRLLKIRSNFAKIFNKMHTIVS